MTDNTQNIIKKDYKELIRLISLMGDKVEIDDSVNYCLIFNVIKDEENILVFKLTIYPEDHNSIYIAWKTANSMNYIKSHCFPKSNSQKYIFDNIVTKIKEWQSWIINNNIDKIIDKTLEVEEDIRKTFIKDWTLVDFCKEFGPKMQIKKFTNSTTGESFSKCRFIKNKKDIVEVSFYSRLGSLTADELINRKNELFVGMKIKNGEKKYYIHDKDIVKFENVDLNI